ncbi:hypothetical protein E4T52_09344 [Aureobasidium sp. EXF-3400]|nr:hypothetical protein E4T51_09722 [Aureobasidium sp. EXF-12344]KAI4775695.1 hypothetical protein E4T52_09344 [Aureobasidium sp. EXF-3400]
MGLRIGSTECMVGPRSRQLKRWSGLGHRHTKGEGSTQCAPCDNKPTHYLDPCGHTVCYEHYLHHPEDLLGSGGSVRSRLYGGSWVQAIEEVAGLGYDHTNEEVRECNTTSRSAACNSKNFSTSLDMEVHTPSQMSFPRSPGVHNLAAYDPKQDPRSVQEVTVKSFAGESSKSGITHPKPARPLIRRYSELLDPTQLDSQRVKRSSDNMLTGSTYNLNQGRLSVEYAQEARKDLSAADAEEKGAGDG